MGDQPSLGRAVGSRMPECQHAGGLHGVGQHCRVDLSRRAEHHVGVLRSDLDAVDCIECFAEYGGVRMVVGEAFDMVVEGDGFLYKQVRIIAGTLVMIGMGLAPAETVLAALGVEPSEGMRKAD